MIFMITEDYCSPKVAKLLDNKGFREYCEAIYFILENGDYRWSKIDIPIRDCSTCKPAAILCPTHQMAMKWLREKKLIFINIRYVPESTTDHICPCYLVDIADDNTGFWVPNNIVGTTYEETVEEAILFTCKNII